jgi:hypothetical protein
MVTMKYLLLLLLILVVLLPQVSAAGFGIPGTTQTISGYDTELGRDPICWRSYDQTRVNGSHFNAPNPLVDGFELAGVELLEACPELNYLTATAPPEFLRGERLRTDQIYYYTVQVTLNLDSLDGDFFVSDIGHFVAIQVLVCRLGVGFCSPFIRDQADWRLANNGMSTNFRWGDSHGGTHTNSGFNFFEVPPENGPIYNLTVTVPMLVNDEGAYFAIASIQMYTGDALGQPVLAVRLDMANALTGDQRLVTFQAPADILVISEGILIASYVAIGITAIVILFLLEETIKYRNHQVLILTQGYFLIALLVAALVLTVSSFLFEPKNDAYCQAAFPIALTSAQLVYAITFGRLWRINTIISPLLVQTLKQKEQGWSNRVMEGLDRLTLCGTRPLSRKPKTLRKEFSSWQLAKVVALFTLPQVIIQVLSVTLQPQHRVIDFNENESIGRTTCDSGEETRGSLLYYGIYAFLLLVVALLFMAQATRQLPKLFNETQVIFDCAVLLILGIGIIIATNDPTASPAVEYMVYVVLALSVSLNMSLRIMIPKLRMVWRSEKVLISKVVSDHKSSVQRSDEVYKVAEDFLESEDVEDGRQTEDFTITEGESSPETLVTQPQDSSQGRPKRRSSSCIVVKIDETPARQLVLQMVDLQEELSSTTERIMSGLKVSEEEWMAVRRLNRKLGEVFHDEVEFSWEKSSGGLGRRTETIRQEPEEAVTTEETEEDLAKTT